MTTTPVVAITGVNGFIGRALAALLVARGLRVIGLSRQRAEIPGVEIRPTGTRPEIASLSAALAGATAVVHLAALAHRMEQSSRQDDAAFDDNLVLTEKLLLASQAASIGRFVFISSIGVNGQRTVCKPFTERDGPSPMEAYARSKLRCEEAIEAFSAYSGLPYVILRPPLVYGRGAPGNFGRLVRAIDRGWPLPFGAIRNERHFLALDNAVDAIALSLVHPKVENRTFLLADGEAVSTSDFLRLAARAMGRRAMLLPVPVSWLTRAASMTRQEDMLRRLCDSLTIDTTAFREQSGWAQRVTLTEGLSRSFGRDPNS